MKKFTTSVLELFTLKLFFPGIAEFLAGWKFIILYNSLTDFLQVEIYNHV